MTKYSSEDVIKYRIYMTKYSSEDVNQIQNIYDQIQFWRCEPNLEYIWPNTVLKMWTKSRIYMTKYSSEDVNQIQNIYDQIQFWRCDLLLVINAMDR